MPLTCIPTLPHLTCIAYLTLYLIIFSCVVPRVTLLDRFCRREDCVNDTFRSEQISAFWGSHFLLAEQMKPPVFVMK